MSNGLALGARESQGGNRIYVNIRAGKIGQTLSFPKGTTEEIDAQLKILADRSFYPHKSVNGAGEVSWFVAHVFDDITGYVKEIRWYSKTFQDGGVSAGWNITVDTGEQVYVIFVSSKERPYYRLMNILIGVDFTKPVMFRGFMGDNEGKPQKVLLLCQEMTDEGKEVWLQPAYQERWLSNELKEKLRVANLKGATADAVRKFLETLPEKERKNLALTPEGLLDNTWPYIKQKVSDNKWSFDDWEEFLVMKMNDIVIPNVQAAISSHTASTDLGEYTGSAHGDAYEGDAPTAPPDADDDIPF